MNTVPAMQSPPSVPAPYGRASSKRRSGAAKLSASKVERAHGNSGQTVQLQKKLDELLSILKPGDASALLSNDAKTPNMLPSPSSQAERTSVNSWASTLQDAVEPSADEAEANLITFKACNLGFLPILCFSPEMTAQQLRSERPNLWLCIMAITSRSTAQSRQLSARFRQSVAQSMVINSGTSLDLLQALLVFIGWFNLQGDSTRKPSLAVFVQLATAAVFDLGLHRPPLKDIAPALCLSGSGESVKDALPVRSIEERRTVLGCFLVTSIMSAFLPKLDALRWTAEMHTSLQVIQESCEHPADQLLTFLVRLQLITERITLSEWYDGTFDESTDRQALQPMYIQALLSEVQDLSSKLPDRLRTDTLVLAHLHTAEISIHHMGLAQISKTSAQLGFQRLKCLTSCLQSLKVWFDNFFNIPVASYPGLPFSVVSQIVRCLGLLYHLSTLDEPGWDKDNVKATADIVDIITRVATNMEQVALLTGIDNTESPDGDVFGRTAKRFRAMATKWSEKLRPVEGPVLDIQMAQPDLLGLPDPLDLDWSDNSWMMDFSTMPSYYQMMPS